MENQELAKILREIALYMDMDDVAFKPQAYERAALVVESLQEDISEIYRRGGIEALENLPGVGKGIAEKIVEYLKTGKIKEYLSLKKKMPVDLEGLMAVEGIGPKKIKILYKTLNIKNLKELATAAEARKISSLPGFGEKTEKNILEGIKFLKRDKGRFLLGEILPVARKIEKKLQEMKEVKKASIAGSLRRMKETIGDVDFLVVSDYPGAVTDFFVSMSGVAKVWGKGATKASVRMRQGYDMDVRIVPEKSFGSALQYFTGSKEHNIATRKIAIEKGLKLNEYGIFKGAKAVGGKTEEEIYKILGLKYIEPELRENAGEVEATLAGKIPELVRLENIKGDLHCHSGWGRGGGHEAIKDLIEKARELGYEYIGISDHTKFLRIEHGLDEKQLLEQKKFIEKLNKEFEIKNLKFKIFSGCEANIMADGSIDISDEVLAKLDYVIAGVHSQFKMPKEKMTARLIKAMDNPHVDIISHPTGRLIQRRGGYEIDFDKILEAAKRTGTILEINAHPIRLDLKDTNIRKAKEAGVKMIINTDAHQPEQMDLMEYGISQARRGWARREDIINTYSVEKLLRELK